MSYEQQQNFSGPSENSFTITSPGIGGLNLQDVEYNMLQTQSPKMLNMMYTGGTLTKRYGQEVVYNFTQYGNKIYAIASYLGDLFLHIDTKVLRYEIDTKKVEVLDENVTANKGMFINFNKYLYYMTSTKFYQYSTPKTETVDEVETTTGGWKEVEPYAPDVVINRVPDGSTSDTIEDYNRYGNAFKNTFNGDGSSTKYVLTDKNLDEQTIKVTVDEKEVTNFTVDYTNGTVTFTSAPSKGQNNVVITAYKTDKETNDSLLACTCWKNFGGQNNSRLFVAGNGKSIYYYSEVFDASYFPENNYATVGNPEEDITGFGDQYDTLIVLKPHELNSVSYYTDDDDNPKFKSSIVNTEIGCDVPNSIQLIDNKLTWLSTAFGVCCLESTYVEDERNVKTISRNINGTVTRNGLLQELNLKDSICFRHDGKYFIVCPSGNCYMWDFTSSPYSKSTDPDNDALKLAWFLFDNINMTACHVKDTSLYYGYNGQLCTFNANSYLDFNEKISCYYQTPIMTMADSQGNSLIDYYKTFKRLSVLCRGDTANLIKMYYMTEEDDRIDEPRPIKTYGRLWKGFKYSTFGWRVIIYARTETRRMNLKKFMQFGIMFYNDDKTTNMQISVVKVSFITVKRIK